MKYLFVVAGALIYMQAFSQRDTPDVSAHTVIGIQEPVFTENDIRTIVRPDIHPYIPKVPIFPVTAERSIILVPPCLIDCPVFPDTLLSLHSCRGRTLFIIDGIKIRDRSKSSHIFPEPATVGYRGLSLGLEGVPADMTGFPASLQPAECKRFLFTPRIHSL